MATVLCAVIAVVLGGMVVQTTGLDEASAPVRAVAPIVGATDLDHTAGIGLDLIQDQTLPVGSLDLPERPELPERPPKYRKDQGIIGGYFLY